MIDSHFQHTLGGQGSLSGFGVHSGKEVVVTLKPAPINHGVQFVRIDEAAAHQHISLKVNAVTETMLQTVVENEFGVKISTIEHLMAALYGLGVDNCLVEVSAEEMPILDGSAKPWVALIDQLNVIEQNMERNILVITKPVTVDVAGRVLQAVPDPRPGLRIEVMINFPHPSIGMQEMKLKLTAENFREEIAPARTFCLQKDIDSMQKAGLIKGGSLACALVFADEGGIVNKEGARFDDEPVRHKMLDLIGDLSLCGRRIWGKLSVPWPGHAANNEFLKAILEKHS